MEAILFGLGVNILTWIAGKFKISKTYASIILCLIAGLAYYVMITYFSATREQIVIFTTGVYATSQLVYNVLKKRGILERMGVNI